MASIYDTNLNELAGRLIALLCPSDTATMGSSSVAPPPFKATLWPPRHRVLVVPLARGGGEAAVKQSCRLCDSKEHTAYNWATLSCYNCNKKGHILQECPEKLLLCQECGAENTTFNKCPKGFTGHTTNSGNVQQGGQK